MASESFGEKSNGKSVTDIFEIQLSIAKPKYIFFTHFNSFDALYIKSLKKVSIHKRDNNMGRYRNRKPELFKCFDLVLCPLHYMTDFYNENGVKTEYFQLSFDPENVDAINQTKDIDLSFVGSINSIQGRPF